MGNNLLIQSPFAVLTFIAAPAILTSASSVLAMGTINRMLRARERMHELYDEAKKSVGVLEQHFHAQVNRVEQQGLLLVNALRYIYVAIGAFAAASLVTLLGVGADQIGLPFLLHVIMFMGLLLGIAGVGGLIIGCLNLFKATELSLINIREEAELIRAQQQKKSREHDL